MNELTEKCSQIIIDHYEKNHHESIDNHQIIMPTAEEFRMTSELS